jgi:hypothetical protein
VVAIIDDEPVGVIGIAREAWTARFFSDVKDELEPYLDSVLIMRAVKTALQFVRDYPTSVYAAATHDEGARILQRLGFEQTDQEGIFAWPHKRYC